MQPKDVAVRPATEEDMPFVRNSWCKATYSHLTSLHYLARLGRPPRYEIYKTLFDGVMDKILESADVDLAVVESDPDSILGYCVSDGKDGQSVLHYIQVKKYMWRKGIAKSLLDALGFSVDKPCVYTFASPILMKWRPLSNWQYIPHWMIS